MKGHKPLIAFAIFFYLLPWISAIPLGSAATGWIQTYGGTNSDESGNSVIQTNDGGYAIVGSIGEMFNASSYDALLVKTDASGKMQWNQTYGGTESDSANSVVQTRDGGYAIAGTTGEWSASGSSIWLVKTDASGKMQWNQTYGGDHGYSVVQTSDGGYAIAGGRTIVKTDSLGNMQWNQTYESGSICSFVQTNDGGFALGGKRGRESVKHGVDFWLIKTDSSGNMQWNQTYYESLGDVAQSVIQTMDGGYALAGFAGSLPNNRHQDFMLVKTDPSGRMQWTKMYGGISYELAYSVVQTTDGGYVMAGYADLWEERENLVNRKDYNTNWVVKTDSSGNIQWSKTYGSPDKWENAKSIIQTTDGGYAIVGEISLQSGEAPHDFWLVKTDENGNVQSNQLTPSPGSTSTSNSTPTPTPPASVTPSPSPTPGGSDGTGIPGFPYESVILGIVMGAIILWALKLRH